MRWTAHVALTVLVACGSARADEFADEIAGAARENPAGVVLRLSSPAPRYRIGERIPVVLVFEDTSGAEGRSVTITAERPRASDFRFDGDVELRVSPDQGWVDPLQLEVDHGHGGGGVMGAVGESAPVNGYRRELDLNEWVRFDRPGTYHVACRVAWVWEDHQPGGATTSTILELELVAADAAFEEETIARAREQLARPLDPDAEGWEEVRAARDEGARALAFLATPAAVEALLRATGEDIAGERLAVLVGARDRRAAVAALEAAITDPHVGVDEVVVRAWERLTAPPRPAPLVPEDFEGEWTDDMQALLEEQGRQLADHREREERRVQGFLARAVAALGDKQGDAFAVTCGLVAARATVELPRGLRDLIAGRLLTLPPKIQGEVLADWPDLRAPSWATPLKQLVTSADVDVDIRSLGLRCLHELEPAWVERYVLEAWPVERAHRISNPYQGARHLRLEALLLVPPGAVELDEPLLERLLPRCDVANHEVIERHAAAALLPRVQALATGGQCHGNGLCRPLERFWIRHDRAGGLAFTRAQHGTIPPEVVAGIEWGPDVEALIPPPGSAWDDPWRSLDVLAQRWGHDRLVAWWQALEVLLRERLLGSLLRVGLGDEALSRVKSALRTAAEREAFDEFSRARGERADSER